MASIGEKEQDSLLDRFFGKLPNIKRAADEAETAPQASVAGINIDEFLQALQEDQNYRDIVVLVPLGGPPSAYKSIIRKGFHQRFARLDVDGVYTECLFESLDEGHLRKIHGDEPEWGSRRRGLITTGDNRSDKFDQLAQNPCWIRLGEPTAESIRQALLADRARIRYAEPSLPNFRILEAHIKTSLTTDPLSVVLNDGYTAISGGRGSGKSAVLEYIRFALGTSNCDHRVQDTESSRLAQLVEDTIKDDAKVALYLERNGVREWWTRTAQHLDRIDVTTDDGDSGTIDIATAQSRFPVRGFNQKQLSSLVTRSDENHGEYITEIAAAEERRTIEQNRSAVDRCRQDIDRCMQDVIAYWSAEKEVAAKQAHLSDLKRQLEAVEQKLNEKGISEEDQEILSVNPEVERVTALIKKGTQATQKAGLSMQQTLLDAFPRSIQSEQLQHRHLVHARNYNRLLEELRHEVARFGSWLEARAEEMVESLTAVSDQADAHHEQIKEQYRGARTRSSPSIPRQLGRRACAGGRGPPRPPGRSGSPGQ
jgi:hypothetical protein